MIDYYEYIAQALFYLDEAGDYETACQVYTNLASYFYDLGNYRVSGVLIGKAINLGEVSGYSNKEIALSAYRMYAKLLNREELPEEVRKALAPAEQLYNTKYTPSDTDYGDYVYKTFVLNKKMGEPVEMLVCPKTFNDFDEEFYILNPNKELSEKERIYVSDLVYIKILLQI